MTRYLDIRPGAYHDSVALMQASQRVRRERGVNAVLVAMATELNLGLLDGMGIARAEADGAGPNDLLVALDADDEDSLARAVALVDATLAERTHGTSAGFADVPPARTVRTAADRSDPTIAFISTPGQYAFADAMDALEYGIPVIVFSDNVSLDEEIRLKHEARRRSLLVMGPDCGTAVIGGAGFGFANVVRPGPVGLVAASGTGAQQLMCLLDSAGVGISHCLGVGGRDMSDDVGAASTLASLELLAGDDATRAIVVVGKPPAPDVAERVRTHATTLGKPVHFALLGRDQPDLTAAARSVVESSGHPWTEPQHWPAPDPVRLGANRRIRGLFAGGSLCDEAMVIVSAALGPVRSNIPLRAEWTLTGHQDDAHTMVDYGDDAYTQGRPHPMIDNTLRAERIRAEAADPACGVLMLDVVLGHGAHHDPAAELAPAITEAREHASSEDRDLAVVISLIGTTDDPQDLERQARALRDAGASVHLSNAAAAREAVELIQGAR